MQSRRARGRVLRVAVALTLLWGTTAGVAASAAPAPAAAQRAAADPADRKRALQRELQQLRETLEGTSADLVAAAVELRESQSDLTDARAALASAQTRLAEAQARDKQLEGQLALAVAGQQKAEREYAERRDQEGRTRLQLGRIAREAYLSGGIGTLAVALDAQSPDQFADRVSAVNTALRAQNGAIERLDVQQADTRARKTKLTAARKVVADLKAEAEKVVAQRQEATAAATSATEEIVVVVARQDHAVGVIEAKKAAEQQRVDAMEREESRLEAILAARARRPAAGGGQVSDGGSVLSRPVNAPITSGFGMRYHPVLHYWRLHAGTDFGAPCGTPVRAAAAGSVVRAGWAGGYGNQLVLDHGRMRGKHIATSYNHLTRILVHSGSVRRGQVVAYSGTTGLSTGCHLHFEVYVNGTHVNPMGWL